MWEQATVVVGSGYGSGWLNEHFINDGQSINQPSPGVPPCGPAPSSPTPGPAPSAPPAAPPTPAPSASPSPLFTAGLSPVFYSPNGSATGRPLPPISSHDVSLGTWSAGYCSASKTVGATPNGTGVLAGWSLGRLGPIYFLASASAQRKAQVHAIILFDPGDTGDFAKPSIIDQLKDKALGRDPDVCDWQYSINSLLANWLDSNPINRLVVLTGSASEEPKNGKPTYAGLWHYYFAGIWNKPFADQAQVCDYGGMGHNEVLEKFAKIVKSPPQGCPSAPSGFKLTAWNP